MQVAIDQEQHFFLCIHDAQGSTTQATGTMSDNIMCSLLSQRLSLPIILRL
jgi:hypothetical protein